MANQPVDAAGPVGSARGARRLYYRGSPSVRRSRPVAVAPLLEAVRVKIAAILQDKRYFPLETYLSSHAAIVSGIPATLLNSMRPFLGAGLRQLHMKFSEIICDRWKPKLRTVARVAKIQHEAKPAKTSPSRTTGKTQGVFSSDEPLGKDASDGREG